MQGPGRYYGPSFIQKVSYNVCFLLEEEPQDTFTGVVELKLAFSKPQNSVFVDFFGDVESLHEEVDVESKDEGLHRIIFVKQCEEVRFILFFCGEIRSDFKGFFRSEHDASGAIFSQGEPYGVNFIMPNVNYAMFKSDFQVSVVHARGLQVFSNEEMEEKQTSVQTHGAEGFAKAINELLARCPSSDTMQLSRFVKMKSVPIHLMALCVGEFRVEARNISVGKALPALTRRFGGEEEEFDVWSLPSRLIKPLCLSPWNQRSIEDYLYALSELGLAAFRFIFGAPFPFAKLDWAFCKMNFNGMENPGLVMIHSDNLEEMPPESFLAQARTRAVLHEICHMYWGNLVVIADWANLWVKEGVAEHWARTVVLAVKEAEGKEALEHFQHSISCSNWNAIAFSKNSPSVLINELSERSWDEEHYTSLVYSKSSVVFSTIAHIVGARLWRTFFTFIVEKFSRTPITHQIFFEELYRALSGEVEELIMIGAQKGKEELIREILNVYCKQSLTVSCTVDIDRDHNEVIVMSSDIFPVFIEFCVKEKLGNSWKSIKVYIFCPELYENGSRISFKDLGLKGGESIVPVLFEFGFHNIKLGSALCQELFDFEGNLNVQDQPMRSSIIYGSYINFKESQGLEMDRWTQKLLKEDPFSRWCCYPRSI